MSRFITKFGKRRCARNDDQRGMTLVELLIAMVIISFLASILLGAAAVAGETARETRTKQLITRLHTLLMERYESYRTRRVEADFDGTGQALAAQRLHVLRTIMQMEMPDRWSDVLNANPTGLTNAEITAIINNPDNSAPYLLHRVDGTSNTETSLIERTPLNQLYLRQFSQVDRSDTDALLLNQSAECLYLTVIYGTAEGEARGLFKENVIGDTDGDGALEFLDGWGNPIRFLRWAKGYDSYSDLQSDDGLASHDPFDVYQVDSNTHRGLPAGPQDNHIVTKLVPLIYSAGPDEEYGMATTVAMGSNRAVFRYSNVQLVGLNRSRNNAGGQTQLVLNPYIRMETDNGEFVHVGTDMDSDEYGVPTDLIADQSEQHVDNLTNHQITAR